MGYSGLSVSSRNSFALGLALSSVSWRKLSGLSNLETVREGGYPFTTMVKFDKVEFILMVAGMVNCLNFAFEPELMGSIAHSRKGFPQAGAGTSCTVPCYLGDQTHQSRRSQGLLYCVLDLRFRPLPQVLFLLFLCSRCTTVTAFNMCIPNMG